MTLELREEEQNQIAVVRRKKRRRLVAVALSYFMPGLGQVYCGRFSRGAGFFCTYLAYEFIVLLLISFLPPAYIIVVPSLIAAGYVIPVFGMIDSFLLAKRAGTDYELKAYNRWYIYPILMAIAFGIIVGVVLVTIFVFVQAFEITTNSCYPTLIPQDRVLVKKLVYIRGEPERGDMVLFQAPDAPYAKRVVAVAGDTVKMKDNELYVNDQKLMRKHVRKETLTDSTLEDSAARLPELAGDVWLETNGTGQYEIFLLDISPKKQRNIEKAEVPEKHVFVLGDNRSLSLDSRHFGPIPLDSIIGRVDYIYQWDGGLFNIRQLDPK